MSKQVLDRLQMRHLKELGVSVNNASMCWLKDLTKEIAEGREIDMATGWNLDFNNPEFYKYEWMQGVPTLTLQDILDLLPREIHPKDSTFSTYYLFIDYYYKQISCSEQLGYGEYKGFSFSHNNILIDAAYEMLCWCIEKGYVSTDK